MKRNSVSVFTKLAITLFVMKVRLHFITLAVLVAFSVSVEAAVISINIESKESGQTTTHMYGDVTGSFVTGTNTRWNILYAGDSDGYAFRATTDVLGTMDGATIQNDVKFTIVGWLPEAKRGRLWASNDYIFCQDGGSHKIDEYQFSYTGLVPGESYDLLFRVNRSYTQVTIDGVTKISSYSTNMLTFNGAIADGNGVITGYLSEAPGMSADKLFWMQIKGQFQVFTPETTVRPMIKANEADKIRFLGLIDSGYDKAINCLNNLKSNISGDIIAHQTSPANFIAGAPRIKDSAEGVSGAGVHSHINWGQRASNAGRVYFITGEEKYAQCAADMINHYVQELGYVDRTPQASSDGDQRDYRDVYEKIATCYDYIRNYLVQPGTTVYDAKSGANIPFDDDKAQIMFKNIVERGFQVSNGQSNITVMEIDSILYSALCIEDSLIRYTTVKDVVNRASGLSMMKRVMIANKGIWPESSSYNGVGAGIPNLMRVVDRIYPEYHLFDGYQAALNGALDRSYYVYPSEQEKFCFGDAHRAGGPTRNEDRLPVVRYLDASDHYRNSFSEVIARYYSQLLAEREKYGYNPSDPWNVDDLAGYEANFEVTHSVVHPYAGLAMQDNVNCTDPAMHGFKYYQGGASYVHSHLTGIDLELYGAGVVMSGVAGAGIDGVNSRGDDLFINYYRRYAGHNTVVVNGESLGLSSGWKGYDYNCMNTVKLVSMEPEPYTPPVSDWFTFSCQKLNDTASDALQQRTVGIVRTGDTSGYYIDLFRSRHNNDNLFHDYIYHNIGDSLSLTSGGAAVPLQQDTQVDKQYVDPRDSSNPDIFDYQDWTRYPSVPMMPVGSSKNYLLTFPGWNFFKSVAYSAEIETPVVGRFDMTINNIDRHMHVNMPGGVGREYTSAQAPKIIEGAGSYDNKNSKVLSIRQYGEAWDRPFVVVFEPSTNASPTVQSVEHILDNGKIVGARVVSRVGPKFITDLIISQDTANATYTNPEEQIEFTGRYAVARTIENGMGYELHLYIGDGQSLSFKGHSLTAGDNNSACQSYDIGTGGDDMITWSGEGVEMAPRYSNGYTPLFWTWSADPADGVEFSPDKWAEKPTVTITKFTDNPSVVTLTLTANDGTGPVTDTMTIDVYDDACKAAIGAGVVHQGDLDGDCFISFEDLYAMAADWLVGSDMADFTDLASMWFEDYSLEGPVVK